MATGQETSEGCRVAIAEDFLGVTVSPNDKPFFANDGHGDKHPTTDSLYVSLDSGSFGSITGYVSASEFALINERLVSPGRHPERASWGELPI